jgi:hypothetical protein
VIKVSLALSDAQLKSLMTLAAEIVPEKRSAFLERVGGDADPARSVQ